MRRLTQILLAATLITGWLQGGHGLSDRHFFGPPRTLFFFQPSLYFQAHTRPVVISPVFHVAPNRLGINYVHSYPKPAPSIYPILLNSNVRGEIVQANTGNMILQVTPPKALVYVDGKLIGSGQDFTDERNRYPLMVGTHDLRIEFPGFLPFEAEMEVAPNRTLNLEIQLQPQK